MLTKLLLHSLERVTLLLSINTNPSDCELQIKEIGVSADQYLDAHDSN